MESLNDVLAKKGTTPQEGSIKYLWKLVDPENKYPYSTATDKWYRLTLDEQRKLYLFLLYRRWRGLPFFGTPYEIVCNCHPQPFNWNGQPMINRLMKETKMVRAFYNGNYGIYTADEARIWEMTNVEPLNR